MDSSSSSSSRPYDVFLSFRGEDTRNNFMSHLYAALVQNQIETYMDEITLERGDELSRALPEAIHKSKISIIIFSENYASSSWCLRELVQILECRRQNNQIVLPIFHKVDPSDIKKQKGSYGEAFAKHEERLEDQMDVVQKWRDALTESAQLSGWAWNSQDTRSEAELIKDIVKDVSTKMGRMRYSSYVDCKGLIGIEHHLQKINQWLLSIGSPDVRIVGIWGLGGIGKTTLASVVFAEHYYHFETCYFLENVREESERQGLANLRNKLLNGLFKGSEDVNLGNPLLLPHVKSKLSHKKVLVVLDDVNEIEQLDQLLLGGPDSFGPESRIIVTTRDANVFRATEVYLYELGQLNYNEALQLFQLKAFGGNSPPTDYIKLTNEVVKYARGVPLAIEILGSHLRSRHTRSIGHWEKTLNYLKGKSNDKIDKCLRISYDVGLDEEEKAIFLDIACFFKGENRERVENILDGCEFMTSAGIGVLIDKSLITIRSSDNCLWMHDLVQEMGWKTVQQQSEKQLERYSRLWITEDVFRVLNNNKGTDKVEGIFLNMSQLDKELHLKPEVFQRMSNLRLLKFYNLDNNAKKQKVYLDQNLQSLPCSLRYLHWEGYPLRHLPSSFEPENLVELDMQHSQLEQLFNGVQNLENLKRIDLSNSTHLIQFPDFSHAPNLEKINFQHCTSLPQVPSHCLRNLNKLIDLNLSHCNTIQSLSDGVNYLTSLRTLTVQGCSNLNSFPAVINLGNLVSLNLGRTIIENLPSSIDCLNNLSSLKLYDCKRLLEVPSSISKLDSLKDLDLSGCSILEKFPELPRNIEKLNMNGTAIKEVASSSIECQFVLKDIFLNDCKSLVSLSTTIFKLRSLVTLMLNGCSNLKELPDISEPMKSLQSLYLQRTGIRQLPPLIGHLIGLRSLYMDKCENLESVPNGICNLNALHTLQLSNCLKLECMPLLFGPIYLSTIYLGNCDLKEIPETIKALKLICLHIHNCKNLKFLPELPLTLELLDARGCVSLEMVSSTEKEFTQKFWDDYKTDTYEHWKDRDGCWDCLFYDCLQLDPSGQQTTNSEFQLRVLSLAARPVRPGDEIKRSSVHACYPGNGIPIWFDHQFEGSSITIKLPQQWRDTKFLGFVVCAVGDSYTANREVTDLSCKVKFICLNGENHESSWMFARAEEPVVQALPPAFNSDHVYMWYWPTDYSKCVDAVEVTFRFAFREFDESAKDNGFTKPSKCEVKRCGIRMLYQKDLDEFLNRIKHQLEPPARKGKKKKTLLERLMPD